MFKKFLFGAVLTCLLCITAGAQCPDVCDLDPDGSGRCTGCSGSSSASECVCQIRFCQFDACGSGKSKKCDELKPASSNTTIKHLGIAVKYVPIEGSPVKLSRVISGGPTDLLHQATLYNTDGRRVVKIRIGWIVVSQNPSRDSKSGITKFISVILQSIRIKE